MLFTLESNNLKEYIEKYAHSEYDKKYYARQKNRFEISINCIRHLFGQKRLDILDLGGESHFLPMMLKERFDINVYHTGNLDLRKDFLTDKNDLCDIVLCTEVIEHLQETEESYKIKHGLTFSSLDNLFKNVNRLLKKDGFFLITSPNPSSWNGLYNIITGLPTKIWNEHIHEYTILEIANSLLQNKFEIVKLQTLNVYDDYYDLDKNKFLPSKFSEIKRDNELFYEIMSDYRFKIKFKYKFREDTIFILAKKTI